MAWPRGDVQELGSSCDWALLLLLSASCSTITTRRRSSTALSGKCITEVDVMRAGPEKFQSERAGGELCGGLCLNWMDVNN